MKMKKMSLDPQLWEEFLRPWVLHMGYGDGAFMTGVS